MFISEIQRTEILQMIEKSLIIISERYDEYKNLDSIAAIRVEIASGEDDVSGKKRQLILELAMREDRFEHDGISLLVSSL
jgi:hypothetical protein